LNEFGHHYLKFQLGQIHHHYHHQQQQQQQQQHRHSHTDKEIR
jgi:hypothetical protein